MPYVQRDESGLIVGRFANRQPGFAEEWLADSCLELSTEAIQRVYSATVAQINADCESSITAGFKSAALGAPHLYNSQLDDQLNLTGAILWGKDMLYACLDAQNTKAFRPHTAEQLRQVGNDFTLHKLQLLQLANDLKQQLNQAFQGGDLDAMQRITWTEPQQ
ncbi:DUF4376 domain-containing protein [Pseudomonas gingeri]